MNKEARVEECKKAIDLMNRKTEYFSELSGYLNIPYRWNAKESLHLNRFMVDCDVAEAIALKYLDDESERAEAKNEFRSLILDCISPDRNESSGRRYVKVIKRGEKVYHGYDTNGRKPEQDEMFDDAMESSIVVGDFGDGNYSLSLKKDVIEKIVDRYIKRKFFDYKEKTLDYNEEILTLEAEIEERPKPVFVKRDISVREYNSKRFTPEEKRANSEKSIEQGYKEIKAYSDFEKLLKKPFNYNHKDGGILECVYFTDTREADKILQNYSADRVVCDSFKWEFSMMITDSVCPANRRLDDPNRWRGRYYLLRACHILSDDGKDGYYLTLKDETIVEVKAQIKYAIDAIEHHIASERRRIEDYDAKVARSE
jgi:hypothetical protein